MASSNQEMKGLLEAYLDHQLDERERQQFEENAQDHPEILKAIELQGKMDASLCKMFTPPKEMRIKLPSLASLQAEDDVTDDSLETSLEAPVREREHKNSLGGVSRRWLLVALTTAAAIAWMYIGSEFFSSSGREEIAFHQRPLIEIYQQCIDEGFNPYWVCDDETTFANTFENRQGVKLKLGEMPSTQKMVGLSYLAGISRKSTSMLALVDDQPVIVFIDRIENDWKPATGEFPSDGLTVTRTTKNGLVFYEVSPDPTQSVVSSIVVLDPSL